MWMIAFVKSNGINNLVGPFETESDADTYAVDIFGDIVNYDIVEITTPVKYEIRV